MQGALHQHQRRNRFGEARYYASMAPIKKCVGFYWPQERFQISEKYINRQGDLFYYFWMIKHLCCFVLLLQDIFFVISVNINRLQQIVYSVICFCLSGQPLYKIRKLFCALRSRSILFQGIVLDSLGDFFPEYFTSVLGGSFFKQYFSSIFFVLGHIFPSFSE